jgi:hypothetical protein
VLSVTVASGLLATAFPIFTSSATNIDDVASTFETVGLEAVVTVVAAGDADAPDFVTTLERW